MSGRLLFHVRTGMIGLKKSSWLTGRKCGLSADVGHLWMVLLSLLMVVAVEEHGAYFGESVRNCWRSCCELGLVCLRQRLRVRGKSYERQSYSRSHVGG